MRYKGSSKVEDPRASDMTGLKGVVLVTGLDDGLVPTSQSREMAVALNGRGVPAHLLTVLLRWRRRIRRHHPGLVLGPVFNAAGQEYDPPWPATAGKAATRSSSSRPGSSNFLS